MLEQPYVRLQVVDGQVLHDDERSLVDLEHVESLQHALLLYALFQLEPTLVDGQLQLYVLPLVALYIVPQQGVVPRLLDVLLQLVLQQVRSCSALRASAAMRAASALRASSARLASSMRRASSALRTSSARLASAAMRASSARRAASRRSCSALRCASSLAAFCFSSFFCSTCFCF